MVAQSHPGSQPFIAATPMPVPPTACQHRVAMRDGIGLATDVYLPEGAGASARVPAILVRVPYDKNSDYVFMDKVAERVKPRGYALVVQDVRGKYRSEGEPVGPACEADDGYDTIEWISRQPWCDGSVGMFGDSYFGMVQWAAASAAHPALKAIVPRVTTGRLGELRDQDAGVRDIDWLTAPVYMLQYWTENGVNERVPDLSVTPLTAAFDAEFAQIGRRSGWYDMTIPEPRDAGPAWFNRAFDFPAIPVMNVVGWFDNLAIPQMRDHMLLASLPGWSDKAYLYADSIDHENYHLSLLPVTEENDHRLNGGALERLLDQYVGPAIAFFDVFLKGGDPASLPKVRWHLGHVGYRSSPAWPPAEAREHSLFLSGLASAAGGGRGTLGIERPARAEQVAWPYDPAALVASTVANSFENLFEYPDEGGASARPDLLAFDGAPADAPLDLAGPVDLFVRLSSTAPSADVFAKLLDVAPDGSAHVIVKGQGVLLAPDRDRLVRIEMGHTGYRLRPGHRLRLQLANSDFPEFVPNPGTGENRWLARERVGSLQHLFTDGARAASLRLHVLPAEG